MAASHSLSKKTALAGLQCHKRLWWTINEPLADELRESPALRYRLREGTAVGKLAREYVPGGVLIGAARYSVERLVAETRDALLAPVVPAIYEGAFAANGVVVYTDILERRGDGWTLVEV